MTLRVSVRRCLFVLVLLGMLVGPSVWSPVLGQARGVQAPLIGKVDMRALVLLHPSMTMYDPNKAAFKVEPGKATAQQNQQRTKEQQQRIKELDGQSRALRAKVTELHRNFNRDLSAINDRYLAKIDQMQPGPAGMNRQQFELEKLRLESSYQAKLKAFSGQALVADQELEKLNRVVFHEGFTSPDETQKRFMAIINEVRLVTQQIATQRGIQIVLNSGFRRALRLESADRNVPVPEGLDYSKIFNMPFSREVEGTHDFVTGYYQNLQDMAQDWLKHGSKILEPVRAGLVDSDIILGGVDLTGEVLAALFATYKVNQNVGSAVIKAALEP
jgi:hypothetical protein